MAYELKDQDTTPPEVGAAESRSIAGDGIAAVIMAVAAAGLIALILSQIIN